MTKRKTVIIGGGIIRASTNEELVAKVKRIKERLAEEAEEVWVEEQDFEEGGHGNSR